MFIFITLKRRDFNLNNQAKTQIMESTLFTTLTATEEANLSGGNKPVKPKKEEKPKKEYYSVIKYAPITIDVKVFTNVIAGKDNDGNTQINQG